MKTTRIPLAIALFAGLATFSFAGPSPQFRAPQTKHASEQPTKADVQAAALEAANHTMACTKCHCPEMQKS
jgi:hypothetical protein